MKRTLLRLFAMSVALALQFGAAAQTVFYATVPSGQSLRFETTSPTTCQLAGNTSIGGSETDSLIIPYTVSDGTNTYQVTAIGQYGISSFRGRGTLILPNSITRIEWYGINNNDFDTIIFPAGLNFMDNGAVSRSVRVGSLSVLVFCSATPPATTNGYSSAFTNAYTAEAVQHIYVPAGQTAAYMPALSLAFYYATLHEWGTSTPTVVDRYDTIHPGEVRWINNRPYDGTWTIRDSSLYYTQNLITRVFLQAVEWHFYADAPTGQRLYYRITGTDSVEVRAPNGSGWAYYTKPTDSLAIPATVSHGGHNYSVFRIYGRAFYRCDAITALTLPEGIAEVGPDAFALCEAMTHISIPRSLRIVETRAFNGLTRFMLDRNLTLASDTIWAETIAVAAFGDNIISQPIVLPNVRTIGFAAFSKIYRCPYIFVGDSCTSIGANAFDNAFNEFPGRISLGTSLQTVGDYALSQSATIRSVEFRGATVPSFGGGIFFRTQVDSIITPCGTSAAYRTALDAAPVNYQWDASATLFAERGCQVLIDLYASICAGGTYTFGGQTAVYPSAASVELYDTVRYALYDSITVMHLTVKQNTTGDTAAVACDQFSWYGTDYTASATPTHVLTNAAGCDSTVTLALTINYSNTGDTAAVACDQFSWYGTDYTASATPTHVLTNAAGCDSTVTLALTVNYSNTGDTAAVACDQYSWYGTAYTASATPTHVLTNAAGCDSTVTLALTINYSNTGDTAAVACDQFSWYGIDYTASATPTHLFTNAAGCDSTVTLALTINYSTTGDTAAVACDQFSWYGTAYTASATPTHVLTNAAGCDSTVTLALTVRHSTTGTETADVCDTYTWQGTTYTASNTTDQVTLTNAAGCDSTVTLALTVRHSTTGTETADVCDTYTWQGTTYTASNTTDQVTLTNGAGCDSTVTLNLTIRHSTTGTETADVCDTYTWQGTTYTASNTTDQVTLTNAVGCDSTVTLALTVRHSTTGDTAAVAFDRFAWYGTTYTASGTPTHVLTNAAGCDSTVTLALTILEGYATDPTFGEQGIEVEAYGYCAGPGAVRYRLSSGQPDEYSLIFGHAAWTNLGWQRIATPGNIDITVPDGLPTGDYTATLYFRHSAYPDMVSAPIEVTIHVNLPETYVMPLFSDVIALVDTCHCLTDVQWYHREAGAADWEAIPGANDYYYHQEGGLTGEYFVSARYNGQPTYTCPQSDMATLISDPQPTLTAYPNPTRGVVILEVGGLRSEVGGEQHILRVLNLQGVELERRVFEGSTLQLDLSAYQRGSYVVSVDGMVVRVIRN